MSQEEDFGCFQQNGQYTWPCEDCPSANCNNNGQCLNNGTCVCQENYFGDACQYLSCKDNCNGNGICDQGNKFNLNLFFNLIILF